MTLDLSPLLQAVRGMLDNPNEPVSDLSYFDCIESVMENSKVAPLNHTDAAIRHLRSHAHFDSSFLKFFLFLFLFFVLFCFWFVPLCPPLCAGPGRIHGGDFYELQERRRASVRRLCGLGLQSLVWTH